MEQLFTNLSRAVEGTPLMALAAAVIWGVLSIVLSPCHLALIFFVVGLHLVGVIPLSFAGAGPVGMKRKGWLAAFMLGLVFGIALGPCTFAYMAPMLAVTFKLAGEAPVYGAALLLAYGVGHCGVLVMAGGVWLVYSAP